MNKRYIFTWKDELEEARIKAMAKDEGVTMSEMIHRLLAQTPVIGTVNSETGKIAGDFLIEVTDKKTTVTLIQADGERIPVGLEREIVGHDVERE